MVSLLESRLSRRAWMSRAAGAAVTASAAHIGRQAGAVAAAQDGPRTIRRSSLAWQPGAVAAMRAAADGWNAANQDRTRLGVVPALPRRQAVEALAVLRPAGSAYVVSF